MDKILKADNLFLYAVWTAALLGVLIALIICASYDCFETTCEHICVGDFASGHAVMIYMAYNYQSEARESSSFQSLLTAHNHTLVFSDSAAPEWLQTRVGFAEHRQIVFNDLDLNHNVLFDPAIWQTRRTLHAGQWGSCVQLWHVPLGRQMVVLLLRPEAYVPFATSDLAPAVVAFGRWNDREKAAEDLKLSTTDHPYVLVSPLMRLWKFAAHQSMLSLQIHWQWTI